MTDRPAAAPAGRDDTIDILRGFAIAMYLAHFAVLKLVGRALPHRIEHPPFWALYLAVLAVLCGVVLGWRRLRAPRTPA